MKKCLLFLKDFSAPNSSKNWVKGVKYSVNFENETAFFLDKKIKNDVGIDKSLEGDVFEVREIDPRTLR